MGRVTVRVSSLAVILVALIVAAVVIGRAFSGSSTSPGTGSGVAATHARVVPTFKGIELAGANNVIVRVGQKQSVTVHADDNLLARVTTQVRSGNLVIGQTPGNLSAKAPMSVVVSVPTLDAITLRGDGNISATQIDSPSLTITIPGSGTVHATGTTAHLTVTIGGSGAASLGGVTARDARAALSGDGTIMLTARHSLAATVSGSGAIFYGGNPPKVTQTVTGTGTIMPVPAGWRAA
jgi:Putative auto-transporter adhesin, head GIN domain